MCLVDLNNNCPPMRSFWTFPFHRSFRCSFHSFHSFPCPGWSGQNVALEPAILVFFWTANMGSSASYKPLQNITWRQTWGQKPTAQWRLDKAETSRVPGLGFFIVIIPQMDSSNDASKPAKLHTSIIREGRLRHPSLGEWARARTLESLLKDLRSFDTKGLSLIRTISDLAATPASAAKRSQEADSCSCLCSYPCSLRCHSHW